MQNPLWIGLDTGGTFTDVVLFDPLQKSLLKKAKTPTLHGNYARCISNALQGLVLTADEQQRVQRFTLSTTLATNAVAEGKQQPVALVMEPGDIRIPPHFHPNLTLLSSRIDFDGREITAVSPQEVLQKTKTLQHEVHSFAVSCYGATRNSQHEQQIGRILQQAYQKPVILGSDLSGQLGFMDRARTAALNAGLLDVIMEWLTAVQDTMQALRLTCPLYLVKGDGSLMEAKQALKQPIHTLFSGPAASLYGGGFLAALHKQTAAHTKQPPLADDGVVVIDVGGTTIDIGRLEKGMGVLKAGGLKINQHRLSVDGLDMMTFGLGGDSRFRVFHAEHCAFVNERALPFCRLQELAPHINAAQLQQAAESCWHLHDVECLEWYVVNPSASTHQQQKEEQQLLDTLAENPSTLMGLRQKTDMPDLVSRLEKLLKQRSVLRVALTPTDVYAAQGKIVRFDATNAHQAVERYAHMLDAEPQMFLTLLEKILTSQAVQAITLFALEDDTTHNTFHYIPLIKHLCAASGPLKTKFIIQTNTPICLVGAAAPLMFAGATTVFEHALISHPDGDVANALGAALARFCVRHQATIEPCQDGKGFEAFYQGQQQRFSSVETARSVLKQQMESCLLKTARQHQMIDINCDINETVLESWLPFSREKSLAFVRITGTLVGSPSRTNSLMMT